MNIALVTVDSLRADHLSCYGYERETTPNIDEYAADVHHFTDAVAHACATRPSFPSILTSTHGMLYSGFDHLSEKQIPLSVPLSQAGYTTGAFHSNPYLSAEFGYDRGFDQFSDSINEPGLLSRVRQYVSTNLHGPVHDILSWAHSRTEEHVGLDVGSYYKNATDLTNEALQWTKNASEPWFLWIHYMDPHHPYVPPSEHQVFGDTLPQRRGVKLRQQVLQDPDELSETDWSELKQLYDSEIRYVDDEIGRLLGQLKDTTWLFTADHGEEFYEHGNFGHKNRFYEEHVHVPLLLGTTGSGVHNGLVGLNDVPVTLLKEADVSVPDNYRGEHLLNQAREQVLGGWGPNAGTEPERARLMCRTANGKYIFDKDDGTIQFYDLRADPDERKNLDGNADTTEYEAAISSFEDVIRQTSRNTGQRAINEDLQEQLQKLGYRE